MSEESSEIKKILNTLFEKIRNDEDILAMTTYGSYARDENFRDIDIALFTYQENIDVKKEIYYRTAFPEILDIHFFNKLPLYIKSEVLKDGKILLNKDYNSLFDIYWKTIKEWNLFKPHFELFLEA